MSLKSKLDPRAERSREWMRAALLALMREKEYSKITIAEITDRAGLSRPTFYLHYKSKDDILIEYFVQALDAIVDEFSENIQKTGVERPGALAMQKLFSEVRKDADILKVVLQYGGENLLRQHLYEGFSIYLRDLAHRYRVEVLPEVHEFSAHYLAGSTIGMIFPWLQEQIPLTPEQMGEFMGQVVIAYLRFTIRDKALDYLFE
jgi:AcrR family transcriptional regulator